VLLAFLAHSLKGQGPHLKILEDHIMKKFIVTLAICIGVLGVRASYLPSNLSLRMWDNSVISVVLDGQVYDQYNSSYTFSNLSGGSHFLKVYRYVTHGYGAANNFPKMVFNGYIVINGGRSISSMISADCHFIILSEYALNPGGGNHYGHDGHHGGPHNYNNNGYYNDDNYNGGYTSYNYGPSCMSDYDFSDLKAVVANTTFDDTKLSICKQAVSTNNVSSEQVYELMTLMTFESNKLELAKFAYNHVIDKSRYYIVNNAFTFSSSIDELNRYISTY
jgi:hypothetical protein